MIRAALAITLLPAIAQADAWETFDTYCLTPQIATQSPITPAFALIHEDNEIDTHLLEIGALSLTINVFKGGTFAPVACEMHVDDPALWPETAARFDAWRTAALNDARFVLDDDGQSLLSTDQREPRIRIFAVGPDQVPRPFVAVEETFLES